MANKKATEEKSPEVIIESTLSRAEQFIENNGKTLLTILIAVVVVVGGYFAYTHLYAAPRIKKASNAICEAQYQFQADSFATALNGNASFDGFLTIAEEFGSTPQGNIANHYAGICYLRLGQFQEAINTFKKYKPAEGPAGAIVTAQNYGLMGDAYVELENLQEGVKLYEKAAASSNNSDTAPVYLKKAAQVNEALGNNAKALEQYETIRNDYPRSMQARDVEKFIARLKQL